MFVLLYGVGLIVILYHMSQNQNTHQNVIQDKNNSAVEKHPVIHFFAWIFAILGMLSLIVYLLSILRAESTAEISGLNPFVFVLFGLSAYCFNFKHSDATRMSKLKKVCYVTSLIIFYDLGSKAELSSVEGMFKFLIMCLVFAVGINKYCYSFSAFFDKSYESSNMIKDR